MSRHLKTHKIGGLERFPAIKHREPVTVEYASAHAFLTDYETNLQSSSLRIATKRSVPVGTIIDLALTYPRLAAPIVFQALVQQTDDDGTTIAFLSGTQAKLASLVDQVRNCDPELVTRPVRVLIVEDNAHLSKLVQQGLMSATKRDMRDLIFAFDIADNGADGLALLTAHSFDLAIIDVYLPVLDGASLIAQARETLGLDLPIISISAGGEAARTAALAAGASAFLEKPVRLREVASTMRRVLSMQASLG